MCGAGTARCTFQHTRVHMAMCVQGGAIVGGCCTMLCKTEAGWWLVSNHLTSNDRKWNSLLYRNFPKNHVFDN